MNISKKYPVSKMRSFFEYFIKDCTNAEINFNFPAVILLSFAAFCSDLNIRPVNNNLYSFKEMSPGAPTHIYSCTADSVFSFASYITKNFVLTDCAVLLEMCKTIIDSPLSDCFLTDKLKAYAFCEYALPLFFNFSFEPEMS